MFVSNLQNYLQSSAVAWLCVLAFVWPLRHRRRFWLRFILTLPLVMTVFWPILLLNGDVLWAGHIMGLLYFFLATIFCCDIKARDALYGAVWEIILIQSIYEILAIVRILLPNPALFDLPGLVLLGVICAAALLLVHVALTPVIVYNGVYNVGPRQLGSAVIICMLFIMLFDVLRHTLNAGGPRIYTLIVAISQIYGISVLCMQTGLFRKAALQKELDTLNFLYTRQQEQYAMAKQNIKIINRKCHELKIQIAALREKTDDAALQESLRQAEDSVRIYDSVTKTGNEVLDTLLTEKSLLCGARNIKIHCIADGAKLDFMSATDLYALFAEALENAIDAVSELPDAERRIIDIQIYSRKSFLVVNIANPLLTEPKMRDGFPVSTKLGGATAGWGVRSMNGIVQRYGGLLSVDAENGIFTLHIVFPQRANSNKE